MKSNKALNHIAFIMDGNGRWATKRRLPRNAGHKEGINTMIDIASACRELRIPYVSFYAFSTENKNRDKKEVDGLISLIQEKFDKLALEFNKNNIRLFVMGDVSYFGEELQNKINEAIFRTKDNDGGTVNIALNYGGRDEIERAAKLMSEQKKGSVKDYLYTSSMPDPDVLVRTGGEKRLSNFMLYQLAYTELFFTDTFWPDFSEKELNSIVDEYYNRDRRFGK